MKNIENEDGTIFAGADKSSIWTVTKAEGATYSPFVKTANRKSKIDLSNQDDIFSIASRFACTSAQDLVVQSGNKILEINQPVFSEYGKIETGDKGIIAYVQWDSATNNAWHSNKKLWPRFIPLRALHN